MPEKVMKNYELQIKNLGDLTAFRSLAVLCLSIFVCGTACGLAAVTNDTPWAIYHGDQGLRGVADCRLPDALSIAWRFKVGAPVSPAPVVGGGMIFFVGDNGEAYALTMQGEKVWSASIVPETETHTNRVSQNEKFSTQPVFVDDVLVIGSDAGSLIALEAASGKTRWKYQVGEIYSTANWIEPVKGQGYSVVVISQTDAVVHRIDLKSGKRIWVSQPLSRCDGSPSIGNGFVVFGSCAAALHVLSAENGEPAGKVGFDEDGQIAGGVAMDGNLAFAGTRGGMAFCATLGKDKAELVWTNRLTRGELFATPAVTAGKVVTASSDGKIYCLNRADGKKLWEFTVDGVPLSPVVALDKVVVSSGGTLYILRLEDGKKIQAEKVGDAISSPAVADGRIIVGTDDGFVVMYGGKK